MGGARPINCHTSGKHVKDNGKSNSKGTIMGNGNSLRCTYDPPVVPSFVQPLVSPHV